MKENLRTFPGQRSNGEDTLFTLHVHIHTYNTRHVHVHVHIYQDVIIYFFTGIVGELIMNITVEPMYYIQDALTLRVLAKR